MVFRKNLFMTEHFLFININNNLTLKPKNVVNSRQTSKLDFVNYFLSLVWQLFFALKKLSSWPSILHMNDFQRKKYEK